MKTVCCCKRSIWNCTILVCFHVCTVLLSLAMQWSGGKSQLIWSIFKGCWEQCHHHIETVQAKMDKLTGSWSCELIQRLNPQKDTALESCFLHGTWRPNKTAFRDGKSKGAFKDSSKTCNQRRKEYKNMRLKWKYCYTNFTQVQYK